MVRRAGIKVFFGWNSPDDIDWEVSARVYPDEVDDIVLVSRGCDGGPVELSVRDAGYGDDEEIALCNRAMEKAEEMRRAREQEEREEYYEEMDRRRRRLREDEEAR